ncbi:MAG: DUF1127 domain-containing protein [Pseudaminobacter sp.]
MKETIATAPPVRIERRVVLTKAAHRRYSRATLRGIMATWRERMRFRRELERKSRDDPHLIDDIGLTKRQVEAEIAKPFWRR